jgi:outer membrane protein assembly factor BamE (lipoprotein component of BamABCDE complex)
MQRVGFYCYLYHGTKEQHQKQKKLIAKFPVFKRWNRTKWKEKNNGKVPRAQKSESRTSHSPKTGRDKSYPPGVGIKEG